MVQLSAPAGEAEQRPGLVPPSAGLGTGSLVSAGKETGDFESVEVEAGRQNGGCSCRGPNGHGFHQSELSWFHQQHRPGVRSLLPSVDWKWGCCALPLYLERGHKAGGVFVSAAVPGLAAALHGSHACSGPGAGLWAGLCPHLVAPCTHWPSVSYTGLRLMSPSAPLCPRTTPGSVQPPRCLSLSSVLGRDHLSCPSGRSNRFLFGKEFCWALTAPGFPRITKGCFEDMASSIFGKVSQGLAGDTAGYSGRTARGLSRRSAGSPGRLGGLCAQGLRGRTPGANRLRSHPHSARYKA